MLLLLLLLLCLLLLVLVLLLPLANWQTIVHHRYATANLAGHRIHAGHIHIIVHRDRRSSATETTSGDNAQSAKASQ